MRVVAALGGNALLRRGEPLSDEVQRRNVVIAARALAAIAEDHDLVVTHGNGPQVGLLALQAATASGGGWPLDVLNAESEGMIGYLIEQELAPRLPDRRIATLLTQVEVDPADPALARPGKPIGPTYDEAGARRLAQERGWSVARDGDGWRRVVGSPRPVRILEIGTIRHLVAERFIVICAGGGGIPVVAGRAGGYRGIEAVIDKDHTSALLARDIGADVLLLLTDVPGICRDFGSAAQTVLAEIAADEIEALGLPAGSMGPKAAAGAEFALSGGRSVIARMEDAAAALAGKAGTRIVAPARRGSL